MIASNKKLGRNELCKCGSKKKFKKCCGSEKARQNAQIAKVTQAMLKCFYLIVDVKGPLNFTAEQIESVPDDWMERLGMGPMPKGDGIIFATKKDEGKIIQIDKRIIT